MKLNTKGLGRSQKEAIHLLRYKGAFPGTWKLGAQSQTLTILNSLVKRGFVSVSEGTYDLTEEGRAWQADNDDGVPRTYDQYLNVGANAFEEAKRRYEAKDPRHAVYWASQADIFFAKGVRAADTPEKQERALACREVVRHLLRAMDFSEVEFFQGLDAIWYMAYLVAAGPGFLKDPSKYIITEPGPSEGVPV